MPHPLHEVLVVFAAETTDQLREVTDALIRADANISADQRKAALQKVARHAHSIKGNSGAFGLGDVEALMHALETRLASALTSGERLPAGLSEQMLTAFDRVLSTISAVIADRVPASLKPLIDAFNTAEPSTQVGLHASAPPAVETEPATPHPAPVAAELPLEGGGEEMLRGHATWIVIGTLNFLSHDFSL